MNCRAAATSATTPVAAGTPDQVTLPRQLSGPLLDRIDLNVEVPAVPAEALQQAPDGEPLGDGARNDVDAALTRQLARQGKPTPGWRPGKSTASASPTLPAAPC